MENFTEQAAELRDLAVQDMATKNGMIMSGVAKDSKLEDDSHLRGFKHWRNFEIMGWAKGWRDLKNWM